MKLKVVVHDCATQGETFEELLMNLYDAVEGCLSVNVPPIDAAKGDRVLEIAA
jgi:predicted RNase H-like HicB family nuclease